MVILWHKVIRAVTSPPKLVRLHPSFYMLEHDLDKNLNANVKDDKATR